MVRAGSRCLEIDSAICFDQLNVVSVNSLDDVRVAINEATQVAAVTAVAVDHHIAGSETVFVEVDGVFAGVDRRLGKVFGGFGCAGGRRGHVEIVRGVDDGAVDVGGRVVADGIVCVGDADRARCRPAAATEIDGDADRHAACVSPDPRGIQRTHVDIAVGAGRLDDAAGTDVSRDVLINRVVRSGPCPRERDRETISFAGCARAGCADGQRLNHGLRCRRNVDAPDGRDFGVGNVSLDFVITLGAKLIPSNREADCAGACCPVAGTEADGQGVPAAVGPNGHVIVGCDRDVPASGDTLAGRGVGVGDVGLNDVVDLVDRHRACTGQGAGEALTLGPRCCNRNTEG